MTQYLCMLHYFSEHCIICDWSCSCHVNSTICVTHGAADYVGCSRSSIIFMMKMWVYAACVHSRTESLLCFSNDHLTAVSVSGVCSYESVSFWSSWLSPLESECERRRGLESDVRSLWRIIMSVNSLEAEHESVSPVDGLRVGSSALWTQIYWALRSSSIFSTAACWIYFTQNKPTHTIPQKLWLY